MKKLLLLISISTLVSCAPYNKPQQITTGQANAQSFVNINRSVSDALKTCMDRVRKDSAFQLVSKEVFFETNDSLNKVELMSSNEKINFTQSRALVESIKLTQTCRKDTINALKYYPEMANLFSNLYGSMDIIYADLLSKRITIGEANKQKALLINKFNSERSVLARSIMEGYWNQHFQQRQLETQAAQVEATNTAARAAIAAQYLQNLSNQQMNMTQFYLNQSQNYINQMNSIPRQIPFTNSPEQTIVQPSINCVPNGVGGFRCK